MMRRVGWVGFGLAVAAFIGPLAGLSATFPSAGGDLSSASEWGGEIPGASEQVTLNQDGTYTAAYGDLAYGSLAVAARNVEFSFPPSRRIAFDGSQSKVLMINASKSRTLFSGGIWSAPGCNFYCGTGNFSTRCHDHAVILSDCVLTNLNRVYVGESERNCALTLSNNSSVHSTQFFLGNGEETGCELNVLNGSAVYLTNSEIAFYSDNYYDCASAMGSSKILVDGVGSSLKTDGAAILGMRHPDVGLTVSDRALFKVGTCYVGFNAQSKRCRVRVADGATFSTTKLELRSTDGGMQVSNATLKVNSTATDALLVGASGRTNATFVVSGAGACLDFKPLIWCDVFATGASGSVFALENKASWSTSEGIRPFYRASDSVLKVSGGASLTVKGDGSGTLEIGWDRPSESFGNTLEVSDGGFLTMGELRLCGTGNRLVVSNATVSSSVEHSYFYVGYRNWQWAESVQTKDAALVMCGDSPKIHAPSTSIVLMNGATLRLEIPKGGYASGFVPLEINALESDGNANNKVEIDCADFVENTGGTLTLATVSYFEGLTTKSTKALLDAVAAKLPPRCTLSYTGKKLVLNSPRRSGLILMLR